MKHTAVFLISLSLFFSSFAGLAKSAQLKTLAQSCKANKKKDPCEHQKNISARGCNQDNCNVMLSCGICGFLIAPILIVPQVTVALNNQLIPHYNAGELSDYDDDGWNPPKA